MSTLTDNELDQLLAHWQLPSAPQQLSSVVIKRARAARWKTLISTTVRIPLFSIILCALLLFGFIFAVLGHKGTVVQRQPRIHTALKPVKRLEPIIVRSVYENE
jgi:hypothetical protein